MRDPSFRAKGAAIFLAVSPPKEGLDLVRMAQSPYLDPKRVQARWAVVIRHFRAALPRPPPPAFWRSCPRGRLSSLHDVLDPNPSRRDRGRNGRLRPEAYAKHLVAFLGDALLGVPLSGLILCGHQPQVSTHAAAPFETVGILQGEHEAKRRERPYPLDLAQELCFRVTLFRGRF